MLKLRAMKAEQSKLYFNGYNFNDPKFFNFKISDPLYKYVNNEYRVLLISQRGLKVLIQSIVKT